MKEEKDQHYQVSEEQGQVLVRLARQAIEEKLDSASVQPAPQTSEQTPGDDIFKAPCGNFVTLKIAESLRGCIGSLEGRMPLAKGVMENALNAAFKDPRFSPLTKEELQQVRIEVSVLTEPKPLAYEDGDDLLEKLRPRIDGVIIQKGFAAATFLPQVWEQLPKPKSFLTHLCLKAGLSADEWRKGQLKVSTYQAQYFEEDL